MKVIDILNRSNSTQFSFELLPPLKGGNIQTVFDTVDKLLEYNPAYINITYHREEVVAKPNEQGIVELVRIKRRAGTVGLASAIQNRYKIDVVPHLICGGADAAETEDELIDLDFLGFDNILALRGDPDSNEGVFVAKPNGHGNAVGLVKQISNLNHGIYLYNVIDSPKPTNFCIGVAGYPEKHREAQSIDDDIIKLKQKVDAGADYIVTQLFFDNQKYFSFLQRCRQAGIMVPIIPGIKPISVKEHLSLLPKTFSINIPSELAKQVNACRTNAEVYELGVEWATNQCKELKKAGVPAIHFYTMGRPNNIAKIAAQLF